MIANKDIKEEAMQDALCHVWYPLTEDAKHTISANIKFATFGKNEYIYKETDTPTDILFLGTGKVKICKSGIMGKEQIIRAIKPSELFGFRAYFASDDYRTSAIALEESVVGFLPMTTLITLMSGNPSIGKQLIHQLAYELGKADSRTINLTQKHIRARLADTIVTLRNRYGVEPDGYTLSIYLSREEMANMSNMTTSNAIRTLSAFADEKLIALDGRRIKLIQFDELCKISSNG